MKSAVWVVAVALLASGAASAAVVNFDDLSGSGVVADGYGGINWGGVWTYYDSPQPPYTPSSGLERVYTPGTGSGEYTFSFVTPRPVIQRGVVRWNGYDHGGVQSL